MNDMILFLVCFYTISILLSFIAFILELIDSKTYGSPFTTVFYTEDAENKIDIIYSYIIEAILVPMFLLLVLIYNKVFKKKVSRV